MANKLAVAGPGSKFQAPEGEPAGTNHRSAGFWAGLWHGAIMPITFFISLFNPDVRIYETHNKGRAYDFGFVLGASVAFGGGKKGVHIEVGGKEEAEDAEDTEDED